MDTLEGKTEGEIENLHREGMQWFVVRTLTNQEQNVKRNLDARIKNAGYSDTIADVCMPTRKVTETKQKKKRTTVLKFFPGYLLIQAKMYVVPDPNRPSRRVLDKECWRFIKDTPGIINFLGGEHPNPVTAEEINNIFNSVESQHEAHARPRVNYEPGEVVLIIDGAFKGQNATITEVNPERGNIKVVLTIFGRETPAELEYWQVEKVKLDDANLPG